MHRLIAVCNNVQPRARTSAAEKRCHRQAGAVVAQPAAGTFAADGVAVVVVGRVVYQFRARRAFLGPCTRALLEAGVALAVRACRCPRPRSRTPHWWQRGSWACTCPGWSSRRSTACAGTRGALVAVKALTCARGSVAGWCGALDVVAVVVSPVFFRFRLVWAKLKVPEA